MNHRQWTYSIILNHFGAKMVYSNFDTEFSSSPFLYFSQNSFRFKMLTNQFPGMRHPSIFLNAMTMTVFYFPDDFLFQKPIL